MDASCLLRERCLVRFDPAGEDLQAVAEVLVEAAVAAGLLTADCQEQALGAVIKRELSGSTVMPGGIAFPHGRTEAVSSLVTVLGVFREGRGLADPAGGEPVWLVALMLVPLDAAGNGHIHVLARLSQRLMKAEVVARLRTAEHEDEVRAALGE